jgi:hypothetical protein
VVGGVDAESFKSRDDDENSGPAMVEGEWEMNEELVCEALRGVVFFHNIVDVLEGGQVSQYEWIDGKGLTVTAELTRRAKTKAGWVVRWRTGRVKDGTDRK